MKTKTKIKRKLNRIFTTKRKEIIILIAVMVGSGIIGMAGTGALRGNETALAEINVPKQEKVAEQEATSETVREVTAYNAGVAAQTDSSPCISASGKDICRMLDQSKKVCAANFVPMGTRLFIEGYGECEVLDRMNSRFLNRVDIAMKKGEKDRAVRFGLQKLNVRILK